MSHNSNITSIISSPPRPFPRPFRTRHRPARFGSTPFPRRLRRLDGRGRGRLGTKDPGPKGSGRSRKEVDGVPVPPPNTTSNGNGMEWAYVDVISEVNDGQCGHME